jgi:hypothetical protein
LSYLDKYPEPSRVMDIHLSRILQVLGGEADWRDISIFYRQAAQLTDEEEDQIWMGWLKERKRSANG